MTKVYIFNSLELYTKYAATVQHALMQAGLPSNLALFNQEKHSIYFQLFNEAQILEIFKIQNKEEELTILDADAESIIEPAQILKASELNSDRLETVEYKKYKAFDLFMDATVFRKEAGQKKEDAMYRIYSYLFNPSLHTMSKNFEIGRMPQECLNQFIATFGLEKTSCQITASNYKDKGFTYFNLHLNEQALSFILQEDASSIEAKFTTLKLQLNPPIPTKATHNATNQPPKTVAKKERSPEQKQSVNIPVDSAQPKISSEKNENTNTSSSTNNQADKKKVYSENSPNFFNNSPSVWSEEAQMKYKEEKKMLRKYLKEQNKEYDKTHGTGCVIS